MECVASLHLKIKALWRVRFDSIDGINIRHLYTLRVECKNTKNVSKKKVQKRESEKEEGLNMKE